MAIVNLSANYPLLSMTDRSGASNQSKSIEPAPSYGHGE